MPDTLAVAQYALHEAGLRCTRQRRALLSCLASMPRHFGAEEVLQRMEADLAQVAVSRATLYRLLGELERLGVLRRVLLSEGHSHYEFASERRHNCHLVCSRCGRVAEARSEGLDAAVRGICVSRGFDAAEAEVEITIVCERCRRSPVPGAERLARE
jgi:Fur family transcriptional regulator, ferric uptake regulator